MERRDFIRWTTAASAGPFILPGMKMDRQLSDGKEMRILFQGDSITDAGRDKKNQNANTAGGLGSGYAFLASGRLFELYPQLNLRIHNRGISGHKVHQLAERWEEDTVDLRPDVLSIMIGVNDHWHTLSGRYDGTAKVYRNDYDDLLRETVRKLPSVKLIICEPFILTDVEKINRDEWIPLFDEYRTISRNLAAKYDAVFVPFQSIFDQALLRAPAEYWAADGVHPSIAGAQLMADAWVKGFQRSLMS